MEDEILFIKVQKFRQWWLWVILVIISLVPLIIIVVISGRQLGDKLIFVLLFVAVISLVPVILIFFMKLETQLSMDGVFLKFFPFHLSFRKYEWNNISKAYIRQYNPLSEYGGWGLRFGPSGKAYNVSGTAGLQLELNDGKKILIGTNKQDKLTEVLRKIRHFKQ